MHKSKILWLCGAFIIMGLPAIIPNLPFILGSLMVGGGFIGIFATLFWGRLPLPSIWRIPLYEACLVIYEEIRSQEGPHFLELLDGSHRANGDDEQLLRIGQNIIQNHTLWGKHPPSRKEELVPDDIKHLLSNDCRFIWRNIGMTTPAYTDLRINRKCLKSCLRELKE